MFEKCIPSLLSQSLKFDEIIIVSDRLDLCGEEVGNIPGVILTYTGGGEGGPAARRVGYELAKGEYVFFLDDDDYIDRFLLEKVNVELVSLEEKPACICTQVIKVWEEGCLPKMTAMLPSHIKSGSELLSVAQRQAWGPSTSSGMMISKFYFPELPVDPRIQGFNDVQIWRNVVASGYPVLYCTDARTYFCQYFSRTRMTSSVEDRLERIEEAKRYGMVFTEEFESSVVLGVLLSSMRNEAYTKGVSGFLGALRSLYSWRGRYSLRMGGVRRILNSIGVSTWLCCSRYFS